MTGSLARLLSVTWIVFGLSVAAHASCSLGDGVAMKPTNDTALNVMLKIKPEQVPVSAPFQVEFAVCTPSAKQPARVTIDAKMPLHRHGMNYTPNINQIARGRYAVDGLLFHMPGLWRFEVAAYLDGRPHRFTHDVQVE